MENQHNRKRNRRSSGAGSDRGSGAGSGRGSNYNSGRDSGGSGSSGPNQSTGRSSRRRMKPTQSPETPSSTQHEEMGTYRFSTDLNSMILGVSNVNTNATPKDIEEFLKSIGSFNWFCIFYDHKGKVKGEAEVAYRKLLDANKAIAELNGQLLKEKPVTIAFKYMPNGTPSEAGSVPETSKGNGKKRKKSSDEEEDDPDSEKSTKQPRGIKIG